MKAYLEAVEKILGTNLEENRIGEFDFSDDILLQLKQFSEDYQKQKLIFQETQPQISCYMPLPEILSGDFRTYSGKGQLQGHWPSFEELANLAVLCDRVILYDHLGHYASSAISGYVMGHRHDGLRNWLTALAQWRELIMEDVICIVPLDLIISGPLQNLWDEGELQNFASDVYYLLNPEAGEFAAVTEAEELLQEMMAVEDYLTVLSIPISRNRHNAHYFNKKEDLVQHEATVHAILSLIRNEAVIADKTVSYNAELLNRETMARLEIDALLLQEGYDPGAIARLRREDADLASTREAIRNAIRDFSQNASFLDYPATQFQLHLEKLEKDINGRNSRSGMAYSSLGQPAKKVTFGFAGLMLNGSSGKELSMAAAGMKSTLNNLPVQAQLPGSVCHYYMAVTEY